MGKNAVQAMLDNLVNYLKTNVPSLVQVIPEWPAGNVKLSMPSVSVFTADHDYMNLTPYSVSVSGPDTNNQVTSVLVIGEYDVKLQIDLWCRNKLERDTVFEALFQAMNPNPAVAGLCLQMTDYYNLWVNFSMDKHQNIDDEAAGQRQEYRLKIDVLANCRAVKSSTDYAMITFDTELSTPDTLP